MKQKNRAFTLIELLVVVLIIGILAAVAVPQYQKAVEKSRITQALTFLNAVYKSHQLCVLQHGANSEDCYLSTSTGLANMDIELPGEIETSNCVGDITCIKTKDWEFGTDDPHMFFANRVKNEESPYNLTIILTDSDDYDGLGKISCAGDDDNGVCTSLCGDNPCYVN